MAREGCFEAVQVEFETLELGLIAPRGKLFRPKGCQVCVYQAVKGISSLPSAASARPLHDMPKMVYRLDIQTQLSLVFSILPFYVVRGAIPSLPSFAAYPGSPLFVCNVILSESPGSNFSAMIEGTVAARQLYGIHFSVRQHFWPCRATANIAIHNVTAPEGAALDLTVNEHIGLDRLVVGVLQRGIHLSVQNRIVLATKSRRTADCSVNLDPSHLALQLGPFVKSKHE